MNAHSNMAQSAGVTDYTDGITDECPAYDTKQFDGNAGAFIKAEYPFIAIIPRSIMVRSGNTW